MLTKSRLHKLFLLISAVVVLHGTVVLIIEQGAIALRFYTVQTNLLLVLGFFIMAFLGEKNKVFRSYLSFAVLICISITGVVYNFILVPFDGQPMVFLGWGNFVTHLLSMLLAMINYFAFEKKGAFTFKHIWAAIIPTFLYWVVFMSIDPFDGWYPYFFMTPWRIGWPMVLFWFFVILIFVIGFTLATVFYDKNQKKRTLLSFGLSGFVCTGLIFAFGNTTLPALVDLSYTVEDIFMLEDGSRIGSLTAREIEEGIRLEYEFSLTEVRRHPIHATMQSQDMIAVFLLINNDTNEVLIRSIRAEDGLEIRGGMQLHEGAFLVSWVFFQNYDDVQRFFTRMDFGDIPTYFSAYFQEVFARDDISNTAYISFVLQ
jgi:hypothetical protein